MKAIAVFCGSKNGDNPLYLQHAKQTGELLAKYNFMLVYGGGNKGLMGAVANAVMDNGGVVTGVIPEKLAEWEHSHKGITELLVVPDMHIRKRKMYELCHAAIILPGGLGTMDEMFEMLTWNQLSIHDKQVFILDTAGYYASLYEMMQLMHKTGFLHEALDKRVKIFDEPGKLMEYLVEHT